MNKIKQKGYHKTYPRTDLPTTFSQYNIHYVVIRDKKNSN